MHRIFRAGTFLIAFILINVQSFAQAQLGITFRLHDPTQQYANAFVPGSFNDWGPNTDGRIFTGSPSQMTYNAAIGYWEKTIPLDVGTTYQYKLHVHFNASGTAYQWLTDPLNSVDAGAPDFNSVIDVRDPMFFQVEVGTDGQGDIFFRSGVFGSTEFNNLSLTFDGQSIDLTPFYNSNNDFVNYSSNINCDEQTIYTFSATNSTTTINEIYTCSNAAFVTDWAQDAVWYQLFPERFRNGDPNNDPTRASLEAPPFNNAPADWELSSWTAEWYARSDWEQGLGNNFYANGVFLRRYGGDLQGVIDKLDYLEELGINAIYFNPVFWGPSLHKYDVASYHHIDPHFGPDPEGDLALMEGETENPATWSWTKADSLFLELLQQAKAKNIRIIVDGVFNHSGRGFFAFQDLLENQQASPYADWYDVISFDDPNTAADEFRYESFFGFTSLPEFSNDASGNTLTDPVKEYFFNITNRWMDPNGDGNPDDGIDGWRLDAAALVPDGFWAEWNVYVRSINPNAYTVLEEFGNADDHIRNGKFSAAMNYQAFLFPMQDYFINLTTVAISFWSNITNKTNEIDEPNRHVMQNLMDSHDTERLASMLVNNSIGGISDNPFNNTGYNVRKPNTTERDRQRLMIMFQMGYIGAPMLFYGSESGMWGANDPDDRMPMVWRDMDYENQSSHPFGDSRPDDEVAFDQELFNYYKNAIRLRHTFASTRRGEIQLVRSTNPLIFKRVMGSEETYFVVNNAPFSASVSFSDPTNALEPVFYTQGHPDDLQHSFSSGRQNMTLPAYGGAVYAADGSFAVNRAPVINDILTSISTDEDVPVALSLSMFDVEDLDNAMEDLALVIIDGEGYSADGNMLVPDEDFSGELSVKVAVNDGQDDSPFFRFTVPVNEINDAPIIVGPVSDLITQKGLGIGLSIDDLIIDDPDNVFPNDFTLTVLDGANYTHTFNVITPINDFVGDLTVPIQVSDGTLTSDVFNLTIRVDNVTSLDVTDGSEDLLLYPVPANTQINFTLDNNLSGAFQLRIINMTGKVMVRNEFIKNRKRHEGQIDLSALESGFYFFEVRGAHFVGRKRFVK
ncbi:MAG: alpha-amylase family glycosyl hydrolase [Bacteroidota bacterium]